MPTPYIPPAQANIRVESNILRPDDRDRVQTTAEYLTGDGLSIGLTRYDYNNPTVSSNQVRLSFILKDPSQTQISVGASITENGTVPEISVSTVLLDENAKKLRIYFDRGLNVSDPRAVEALIQHNTVGLAFSSPELSTQYQLSFQSEGTEIHEGWLNIPLSDNQFLSLRSYLRVASQDSGFFWSPKYFSNTGVLVGLPVVQNEQLNVQVGIQPGFSYSADWDDDNTEFRLTAPLGIRAQYTPDQQLNMLAEVGYSYGLTANFSLNYRF